MNNPLSDGNESVIDIFVLGRSETGTLQLIEQLEHQDYRVTLFTDGTELFDTLHHSGKPNLIICDTPSFGQEAYDYCRQIKANEYHWMIPVIILTRASSLGDLLFVLDCNADNFIAQPYDSPYLISMIEGMLQTPVERQTTDQIKTQFKIQHDDQMFVVTADRRKLLEFLLSAFEITVKNSEDLSSAHSKIKTLSSRLKTLEDTGIENARVIEILSASVKKKEQDERTLQKDLEETVQALDEKTAEAVQLSRAFGEVKTLHTSAEEHIRILLDDKEKTAVSYQSETSHLTGQVSNLTQEIDTKTKELEEEKQAREEKTSLSARLDLALNEANVQIEQFKASLQTLTINNERLVSELSSEKNRAQAAEEGLQSLLQAKAQSEKDLTILVNDQKDISRQQNDEILRLKTELEARNARCTVIETEHETLRYELEQLQNTHAAADSLQKKEFDNLQTRFDSAVATMFSQERELKILKDELLVARDTIKKSAASAASVTTAFNETRVEIEEREWKIQSLEKQIADIGTLKEKSDEKVRNLTTSLESVQSALNAEKEQRAAAEERLHAAIRERDENLQSVRGAHDTVKTDLDQHKNDISKLNRDLETAALLRSTLQGDIATASSRIKDLEHELKSAVQVKDQSVEQVRSLAEELGAIKSAFKEVRSALDSEREQHVATEERLTAAIRERDENLQSVRGAHDQTKSDLDVHRNDLMRLNRDLEAATQLTSVLLADFNAASSRINELEHELNSVVQGKEQTGQQARSLSDELERIKAELETERRIRRTAEVDLQKSAQLNSRLEGDIARSAAERERLKAALEQQSILEQKVKALESDKAVAEARAEALSDEIQQARTALADEWEEHVNDEERLAASQKTAASEQESILEQKVKALESDKAAAEARADALSDEIQQARTALADEWEEHVNDEERLVATEKKVAQMAQSPSGTEKIASERERKWAVVVKQTDLPAEIRSTPKAVVVTKPPEMSAEPVDSHNNKEASLSPGIEDLFEDDSPGTESGDRIPESADHSIAEPTAETQDAISDEEPVEEIETVDDEEAEQESDESDDEQDTDEGEGHIKSLDDFVKKPSSYGISFNRLQWLDLIKWSHHSGALSQEQRMQIVRMGRFIQKGRKITKKQEEQVREMIVLVQTLGYQFH